MREYTRDGITIRDHTGGEIGQARSEYDADCLVEELNALLPKAPAEMIAKATEHMQQFSDAMTAWAASHQPNHQLGRKVERYTAQPMGYPG